ncbi:MAG: dephospho-CoA kinase [Paludibacter sp.]|nr:dephospho-CoA kinase [Paludibacter sp.]
MKKPLIIGITGGIGGGKSTLAKKLRMEGFDVFDSDLEARKLQNEHPVIKKELIQLFGDEIYNNNGLNRKKLAGIVFNDKNLLQKLNAIVHPIVRNELSNWIEKRKNHKFLFVESAILFENGMNALVDRVIVMTASEETRIRRVLKRDEISVDQVKARMANQLPEKLKISRADYVIHSDDSKPLVDKMRKILLKLEAEM